MAKKQPADVIDRLLHLFPGNQRASGRFDPKRDRNFTEDAPISREDWERHLSGTMGCGVIPIQDDDSCQWGGLDLDNHGSDEDLPIREIEQKAREKNLPLVMCRSKSGGVHAYVFMDKPQPAAKVQMLLKAWATVLGFPSTEIFPKQARLVTGSNGKRQVGNYMNMPYMDNGATMRYCIHDGKKLSLEQFVEVAEKLRINEAQMRGAALAEHPEAPPCVQKMFQNGVAQGHRNEALYNVVVYLRKVDPNGIDSRAAEVNQSIFTKPLPRSEFARTVASASRENMQYRCEQEPCRSLCDRGTCLTRKFGITPADAERLATTEALPAFTDLIKYMSEPVRWELRVDGVNVGNISTPQLLDWRAIREIVADRLTKVVPMIKNQEWERMLAPLMKEARVLETPDDASAHGLIRDRLREFASKTDMTNRGQDVDDRKALLRGLPVVQVMNVAGDKERCIVFRGQDFVNFLKRTRSEELKGVNLWFAIKDLGVEHTKIRAGDQNINVWYLPVKQVLDSQMRAQPPDFKSEL